MICPNCGKDLKDHRNFCPACGSPLPLELPKSSSTELSKSSVSENTNSFLADNNNKNPIPYLIAVVAIVFIVAAAYVIVQLNNKPVSEKTETEGSAVLDTEAVSEEVNETKVDTDTEVNEINDPSADSIQEYEYQEPEFDVYSSAYDLLNEFYSYAWVNTTNNHDSSYVAQYTVPNSSAFKTFGLDYWQERPDVVFNGIYDINIISFQDKGDGSYDAYITYVYDLYHNNTNKSANQMELAVDNLVLEDGRLLIRSHTWKNDLPVGTNVDISDFN